MVPVPSLPTDNLYKFMGMAGVIMVVASTVMLVTVRQNAIDRTVKTFDELLELSDKRQRVEIELHDMILESEHHTETRSETAAEAQKGRIAAARKRVEIIEQQLKNKQDLTRILTPSDISDLVFSKWACVVIFVIGTLLASYGFWAWWQNVQKLRDEILKAELEDWKRRLGASVNYDA